MTPKKFYIASPFFNDVEIQAIVKTENILRNRGFQVFSPREHTAPEETPGTAAWSHKIFEIDREGIVWADCLVVLYWGNYSDTGTAWECGYVYATGKPAIIVHLGDSSNLMIHEGSHTNLNGLDELEAYDFESMPRYPYEGKMY